MIYAEKLTIQQPAGSAGMDWLHATWLWPGV